MNIQIIIAAVIIGFAVIFAGKNLWNKSHKVFSKSACGDDCGCNDGGKKLTS